MPAPALMFTVVSALLDIVLSVPPEGLAASQSTLAVLTPEQAARASEPWLIATDETPASSTARQAVLRQSFAVTIHPTRHAGQNAMIWRGVDGNSPILQQLIGNVFSPSAWSRRVGPVSPEYQPLWQSGTNARHTSPAGCLAP
jgi:hypothetical protein